MTEPVTPVTPVTPVFPAVRARRTSSVLNVLLAIAALVAVAGVAFAVGRVTTPAAAATANRGTGTGQFGGPRASGAPGAGGFGRGGGAASIQGTVTAMTPTSLTISLPGGQSVTFATDSSTTYHQQTAGSASDVSTGIQVIVQLTGRGFAPGETPGTSPAPSGGPTAASVTVVTP